MLEANYKRDLNHNYLILKCSDHTKADGYEIKMLTENRIDGFLAVSTRYVDGVISLYYEISSKQSMKRVFENREIGYDLLRGFLFHFQQILVKAEEFLVDTKHLIIQSEFIYMNIESNEIALVFHPDYEQDVKEAFQNMAEYFLNKIDHQDNKAVILAYQLYKNTRNYNFTIKEMLLFLQEESMTENILFDEDTKQLEVKRNAEIEMEQEAKKRQKAELESDDIFYTSDFLHKDKVPDVAGKFEETFNSDKSTVKRGCAEDKNEDRDETKIENKTEDILFKIEALLLFILIAIIAVKVTHIVEMKDQEFILCFGIIVMVLTMIAIKIYLDRKRTVIRKKDHHYEDILKESKEFQFREDNRIGILSEETSSVIQEVQIIDFLSEPTVSLQKKEVYGNTVLLGSTSNIEQRKLTGRIHGKEIECYLERLPFTIGKLGSHVDMELGDSSISRMHARFIEKEGCIYLEDLNSTNGSCKNGMPLEANETVRVEAGDEISFAKICFTYH